MNKQNLALKYYLTAFIVIIVLPIIIITLYEKLAGGVLNGFAGAWEQPVIDPNILLLFVNPALLIIGYIMLAYYLRKYIVTMKGSIVKVAPVALFIVATLVVMAGVFWKALTT